MADGPAAPKVSRREKTEEVAVKKPHSEPKTDGPPKVLSLFLALLLNPNYAFLVQTLTPP